MPVTLQEATEAPRGYEVNVSEERKKYEEGALPLAAINLVLSQHVEAVYNLGLRVSGASACADILRAQSQA